MTNIDIMKEHFGGKRYYELRDEALTEWLKEAKQRGVSVRHYVHTFLQVRYDEDMMIREKQMIDKITKRRTE